MMETGAQMIAAERQRQIERKGWTPEHDDTHDDGALAYAAAELAVPRDLGAFVHDPRGYYPPDLCGSLAKHAGNRVRQLVIAGALIAAEIDRLQRAQK